MSAATLDHAAELYLSQAAEDLFNLVGEGVVMTDRAPRIMAVNASFTRITGYTER